MAGTDAEMTVEAVGENAIEALVAGMLSQTFFKLFFILAAFQESFARDMDSIEIE